MLAGALLLSETMRSSVAHRVEREAHSRDHRQPSPFIPQAGCTGPSDVSLQNLAPDEPFGGGMPGVDFDSSDPSTTGLERVDAQGVARRPEAWETGTRTR